MSAYIEDVSDPIPTHCASCGADQNEWHARLVGDGTLSPDGLTVSGAVTEYTCLTCRHVWRVNWPPYPRYSLRG